jgi:hypothetical protein
LTALALPCQIKTQKFFLLEFVYYATAEAKNKPRLWAIKEAPPHRALSMRSTRRRFFLINQSQLGRWQQSKVLQLLDAKIRTRKTSAFGAGTSPAYKPVQLSRMLDWV